MKGHLLYIAFWYPPSRASGVYRAIATTHEFLKAGWDVTVITTTTEFLEDEIGSIDKSLLSHIPKEVNLIRVPFTFGIASDVDVRSMGRLSANFPSLRATIQRSTAPVRHALPWPGRAPTEADRITENYATWIDPVVDAGTRVDEHHSIDYILATGNPFSSFGAAHQLSQRLGTGFSIDYRDPWTIDVFTGRLNNADRRTTAVEREIIGDADSCFHVNGAIADAYRKKFPESAGKHQVVYNGYDRESIPNETGPTSGPHRFGILGTLNDRWPLESLFEAWAQVRAQLPSGAELVLGGHLGYFARSQDVLETLLPEESEGFRYLGPIPKSEVADFYSSLDVVIVPVAGGPMVTSGKVFEALALGKPLVCIQTRGGGARKLADESPLAFGVDPEAASIRDALLRAAQMARHRDQEESLRVRSMMEKYERHRALSPMVRSIEHRVNTGTTTA